VRIINEIYPLFHFAKALHLLKMSIMKNLLIPAIVFFGAASCKQTEPISENNENNTNTAYLTDVISNDDYDDPCNILDVSINKNTMNLVVSYGGGCSTHEFQLAGSSSIMKSLPPKRDIQLLHNGNNDLCKMLITDTISFKIDNLSDNKKAGSEIVLNLKGWDSPISYVYFE
jgi:hypothetical protein